MAASKLFTPRLKTKYGCALDKAETGDPFVNPPTHAEIPVFRGDTGRVTTLGLSLNGTGAGATPFPAKRGYSVRDDVDSE